MGHREGLKACGHREGPKGPKRSRFLAALVLGVAASRVESAVADRDYPAPLTVDVDMADPVRRVFRVRESIPVTPGPLSLHYPEWIQGEHSPSGAINGLTGLTMRAGGVSVSWRRDLRDMFTLHADVPAGASTLELSFQWLSPVEGVQGGRPVATDRWQLLRWHQAVFYPAGYAASRIPVVASVSLPKGWEFACALEEASRDAETVRFRPTTLYELVDSPLLAGRHFKKIELAAGKAPVRLHVAADRPENLVVQDDQLEQHKALVAEAETLFGSRHYDRYEFLLNLTAHTAHGGLEHHQSSDNRLPPDFFTNRQTYHASVTLLPHELVHSWNGKFRRPAGLLTSHYNEPFEDDLLWVYEGLTSYLGNVLTARSGLWTAVSYREALALDASAMALRSGRAWRPLQDTADATQLIFPAGTAWADWRRGPDYYAEGIILWLDVDTTIRERSGGKRSMDDFAKAFFGIENGSRTPVGYTFDDVVAALNAVVPYEWAAFLRARLDARDTTPVFDALARAGWRLAYADEPTDFFRAREIRLRRLMMMAGPGFDIENERNPGAILDVRWASPAFDAGLVPGMKLVAVNGERYTSDVLRDALKSAKGATGTNPPIELLVQLHDTFSTLKLDYRDGPRYPRLERVDGTPDRLEAILKARR